MASVNKVILIGRLGTQPELRYTTSNRAVTELRIATSEYWTGQDGQRNERTEWHSVIVWGKDAENCERYLAKGREVYIEGRLQTRDWTDKDGQKRYKTEVVADRVQFIGGRGEGGGRPEGEEPRGGQTRAPARSQGPAPGMDGGFDQGPGDDDIPF